MGIKTNVAFMVAVVTCGCLAVSSAYADDQPQWGQAHTRNMVSAETGLPESFDPGVRNQKTGEIELPDQSVGGAVVDGDDLVVYYGAADTCIGLAEARLGDLIHVCLH